MMGERTVRQEALFYAFILEEHVPEDRLLRSIDRFVGLSGIRRQLEPTTARSDGHRSAPKLMIRMLLIGIAAASVQSANFAMKCR
jgi:hypothetical protein